MSDLYQQMILDHGRHPRNFGKLLSANHQHEGFNPLCGDQLTLFLHLENDQIKEISFEGKGCAISMASASLMTEAIKGKNIPAIADLFQSFHELVTSDKNFDQEKLGKLLVLKGVRDYPMRVKCATLAWHTLNAILKNEKQMVTTE